MGLNVPSHFFHNQCGKIMSSHWSLHKPVMLGNLLISSPIFLMLLAPSSSVALNDVPMLQISRMGDFLWLVEKYLVSHWILVFELPKIYDSNINTGMLAHLYICFWIKLLLVIYRVTLADQTTYDAKVVGFDQDKDVAVLRVDAPKEKLRPIPVGVSADLLVGQKVYAIGNPVSSDCHSAFSSFLSKQMHNLH